MLGVTLRAPPADIEAVIVGDVAPGSVADLGGLAPGDVIRSLAGRPVFTPPDLAAAVRRIPPGASVEVLVTRDGADRTVQLRF